jgi:hypothetical protein
MVYSFFKKQKRETGFSRFVRQDSSREKNKVFMRVLKKATEDQKKILKNSY